jgi:hypothetical protein
MRETQQLPLTSAEVFCITGFCQRIERSSNICPKIDSMLRPETL